MRDRPANKKSIILSLAVVVIVAVTVHTFGFTSFRSGVRIGYMEHAGRSNWSASYASLDGMMRRTLRPNGEELSVAVVTESGTISIEIQDADGTVIFDEDDIGTGAFQVKVSGKVSIRIDADHHRGSFRFGD